MGEVIEDGDLIFRLVREDEKEKWLKFLPSVFTRTPESYFRRHLERDLEDSSPFSRIVCAMRKGDDTETILGTLRVFKRKIMWRKEVFYSSGIGEVSVVSSERGKKIATKLLNFSSFLIVKSTFPLIGEGENNNDHYGDEVNNKSVIISTLHTGEQAPLYNSIGYNKIKRKFIVLNLYNLLRSSSPSFQSICEFDFDSHLKEVENLYNEFNSRFYGPFFRSELYWRNWVKEETTDRFFLLFDGDRLISYLNVKRINVNDHSEGDLELKDFAVVSDYLDKISVVFSSLIQHWVTINNENANNNLTMEIPFPIYSLLKKNNEGIVADKEIEENGFLVKVYPNQCNSQYTPSFSHQTIEHQSPADPFSADLFSLVNEENFLFWPTDSF